MATYTAIIGDPSSIGSRWVNSDPTSTTLSRRNPQLAAARIRKVANPHIVSDAIGGFIAADFTIPAEEAQQCRSILRYGAVVWLFDGQTPIFVGWAEQPQWTQYGDCQMTLAGPWTLLGRTRMREAWEMIDLSQFNRGSGAAENKGGQVNVNGDSTLTLSFPNGTVLAASDRCSVTYLLFGEIVGPNDGRLITAFEVDISDSNNLTANNRVRVIGATNAVANGDLLWDSGANGSSGIQGAQNLHNNNQGGVPWGSANGYRCLRVELVRITTGITLANDTYATFDRIRVGTREALFPTSSATIDTAAMARDILTVKGTAPYGYDFPQEFWRGALNLTGTDTDTFNYQYGYDPVISGVANSNIGISGFASLPWQSPADIIGELAAIDGSHVGFYLPYNARGGYDAPGTAGVDVGSWWLSAPPQLYYQQFGDPNYSPDYAIHVSEGAVVEPNTDVQALADMEYVNFQSISGRQLSEVVTDADVRNYLYAQGYRRATDYTIQPAVNPTTATTIGSQALATRRQPVGNATITIENTGMQRYPILKGSANVPKLATIRPSSMRIMDIPVHSGLRAGYATHVEWWGQTIDEPEKVQITLSAPGIWRLNRRLAQQTLRANRQRVRFI